MASESKAIKAKMLFGLLPDDVKEKVLPYLSAEDVNALSKAEGECDVNSLLSETLEKLKLFGLKEKHQHVEFVRLALLDTLLVFDALPKDDMLITMLLLMPSELTASIIDLMDDSMRVEVIQKIATPSVLTKDEIEKAKDIAEKIYKDVTNKMRLGGVDMASKILQSLPYAKAKEIIEKIRADNSALSDLLRDKLVTFEDILYLSDRDTQQLMRHVDLQHDMPLALKGAPEDVKAKVFKNLSTRGKEAMREEMEFLGRVRLKEVEEAQGKIAAIMRQLIESGEISFEKDSDLYVS